jgi:hypothetical protein
MTLHVALIHHDGVIHVSDRLINKSGQPFDFFGNKTIVLRADDAIATLGYSGVAHLDGLPTDEWIASFLWGRHVSGGVYHGGPERLGDLGFIVNRLFDAMVARLARGDQGLRSAGLTIFGAGMQSVTITSDMAKLVANGNSYAPDTAGMTSLEMSGTNTSLAPLFCWPGQASRWPWTR